MSWTKINIFISSLLPSAKAGCLVLCSILLPSAFESLLPPTFAFLPPLSLLVLHLPTPCIGWSRGRDAATSFALSWLLLMVPRCLQSYVLVPSDLQVCAEQSGWCCTVCAVLVPGRACCQRWVIKGWGAGLPFLPAAPPWALFAHGDSYLQGMRNSPGQRPPCVSYPSERELLAITPPWLLQEGGIQGCLNPPINPTISLPLHANPLAISVSPCAVS